MTEVMWIRSHVELLLQREWGADEVSVDSDGDYPYRYGTALCWVSIIDPDFPMVRVFAHAARGLKPTAKLLRELNDVQRRCVSAHLELADGVVIASQTISPIGLTQPVLAQAVSSVGTVADDVGGLLAAVFGGSTPFEAQLPDSEDAA